MSGQIIRARDVMQKEILSIDGMASAKDAAAKMRSSRAFELLVAKRNDDDAWGIVTIMDLVKSVIVPGRDAESVFVYEIMTKPVITVPAQMDIRYAIRLMQRIGIRRAPVEDKGEIVGMITLSSLVLNHEIL
ncbi:MAG: CBS domain-containing protein [Desulfosarcina sp.]|nr:CBS domain-containing protein [Desulfosarcina sp.]